MDSDRILVMDAGQAVEFDDAYTLLGKEAGIFSGMVEALGPQEYKRLARIAQDKYISKHSERFEQTRL